MNGTNKWSVGVEDSKMAQKRDGDMCGDARSAGMLLAVYWAHPLHPPPPLPDMIRALVSVPVMWREPCKSQRFGASYHAEWEGRGGTGARMWRCHSGSIIMATAAADNG